METPKIDDTDRERLTKVLAQCPLFRALKGDHFPQIFKAGEVRSYTAGETIVAQGKAAESFFVLLDGEASITVAGTGGAAELGRLRPPSSLGEVGLLLDEARSASVKAVTEVTVLRFAHKAFEAMFQKIPGFGMGLSTGLAHRLSQVSGKIRLPEYDTGKGEPGVETISMLPSELCRRYRMLPLEKDGAVLTVGFVDEPTTEAMSSVRDKLPSMELSPVQIDSKYYNDVMRKQAGVKGWTTGEMPQVEVPSAEDEKPRSERLDALLERMVAEGASDLHLSARHKPYWRIDGQMEEIVDAPVLGPKEVWELLEPIVEKRHRDQFLGENDTDFGYSVPGIARFRVNAFRDYNGVSAVFRQIPSRIMSMDELGLPQILSTLSDIPKGLVLVTGPTGSGKSTTLAAMIDYIKRSRKCHIMTLEDPIEFLQPSDKALVNQREIGGHTTSFGRALRAALREDPDVVLVGELRDRETVMLALETANTGHLVFATLHTNSAISAIDRVIEQFPAEEQSQVRSVLGDVLRGVVAQTLVRKPSGGRLAVLEILVVTLAVSNLIREHKSQQIPSIMQVNRALGMTLFNDELQRLVETKKLDYDEAHTAAVDKAEFEKRFRSGIQVAADPKDKTRFRVMEVKPRSPGSAADLHRGDLITEIGGKKCEEMTLEDVRYVFRTDGKHTLWVERKGQRAKLELDLTR